MLTAYATSCITAFLSIRHNEQMNRHNGEIKKKTYKKGRQSQRKEGKKRAQKEDRQGRARQEEGGEEGRKELI